MTMKRLLLTGAAGGLGKVLRTGLVGSAEIVRLSSRGDIGEPARHEGHVRADLADAAAVERMLEGVDADAHTGGQSIEAAWDVVVASNIVGCINLYEAARKAGTRRIIFASSNHVIGMRPRDRRLDHTSPPRPDSRHRLSKAFGEDLACLHAYKYGVSSLCIRIGSSFPEPRNRRMLGTWQSDGDLVQQIRSGLTADYLFEIVYGVPADTRGWWDNGGAPRGSPAGRSSEGRGRLAPCRARPSPPPTRGGSTRRLASLVSASWSGRWRAGSLAATAICPSSTAAACRRGWRRPARAAVRRAT